MAWINIIQTFSDSGGVPKYGLVDANRHVVVNVGDALPTGTNVIGAVTQSGSWTVAVSGSVAVTGPLTDTQLRATPVPISGTITANQGGSWTVAVSGTVTVSGMVTSNQGTPNTMANRWPIQITDGTDLAEVLAPSSDNLAASALRGLAVVNANYVLDSATWDAQRGDAIGGIWIQGPAANDAAAVGNPVQIGGVFRSTPNTVEDGYVGSFNIDNQQNLLTGVRRSNTVLTAINTTYDNVTTTATSASIDISKVRCGLFLAEVTEANTATEIEFTLQMSHDNSNWYDYRVGPFVKYRFDDSTISTHGTLLICEPFMINASFARMIVVATGTDATNTFTVADAAFEVLD
jgi:hypothetical protein